MLQIGEFAQLGRVSVKMLRHYDTIGLLEPAHIDHVTSYRRYELSQLDRLHRIVALKDLGFTLAQIGRILDNDLSPAPLSGMLKALRRDTQRRLADEWARLSVLDASLSMAADAGSTSACQPVVRRAAPQAVAGIRAAATDPEALFERLEAWVAGYGARAAGPPMLIRHDTGQIEVTVPVIAAIPGDNNILVYELPGLPIAMSIVHLGGYETLAPVRDSLIGGMATHGLRRSGPLRILYHRFGATCLGYDLPRANLATHPGEYVTELLVPVEPCSSATGEIDAA